MEVLEISEDNVEELIPLMGEDLAEDIFREFYRGYGAFDEDGNPVGVYIYELLGADNDEEDVRSMLRFIRDDSSEAFGPMDEAYREDGVDEEEIVSTLYQFEDETIAKALEAQGFSRQEGESILLTLQLKDLQDMEILTKVKKIPDYIVGLSEVSVRQYRAAVKNCLFNGVKGIMEDLGYLSMDWFDMEVSSCTITDGEVSGLFLVRAAPSGTISPMLLFAEGTDSVKNLALMIARSVWKAQVKYPPETGIRIYRTRKQSAALTNRLLPDIKGNRAFSGKRKES